MSTSITNIIQKKETLKEKASGNDCFKDDGNASVKSYAILGILFLIITSDVFIDNVLCSFSSATKGRDLTIVGAIISAIILIMAHIIIVSQIN